MNDLDPQAVFKVFSSDDTEIYKEYKVAYELNNPYVLMETVVRGVENFYRLDKLYTKRHKKKYKDIKPEIMFKYFQKLYKYLEKIPIRYHEAIFEYHNKSSIKRSMNALKIILDYFLQIEYYEKCTLVQNLYNITARKYNN